MSKAAVSDATDEPNVAVHPLGQRILIIDDEAGIRDSLETLLTLEGFRVDLAGDGVAGLDQLTRNAYDLMLLDLALPGESGIDLLPRIKALVPDLPVIMITAYGTVGNVVDAIRAGASNFVQKPWDNEKLLADIRSAIARSRITLDQESERQTLRSLYAKLTPRERDVMTLVVRGLLNKQVGGELGMAEITVKAHRGQIMRKMKAATFADLVNMGARLGLTPAPNASHNK